jgi:hypothetical protein
MAANQEKSKATPKHFDFEGNTNDSDYFLVKRVEFTAELMETVDLLGFSARTNETKYVITRQVIKLLSNAEIKLVIIFREIERKISGQIICVLEFKIWNPTEFIDNNEFHIENSLHVQKSKKSKKSCINMEH